MDLGQSIMKTITTKAAVSHVCRELASRSRQLGLFVVQNESGTLELQATTDEIEDFERMGNLAIDSDVIADELMSQLVEHMRYEELLEKS